MFKNLFGHQALSGIQSTTEVSISGFSNDAGFRDKGFTKRDRRDMQRMGKPQEMMRNFRILSAVSFTVLISSTWEFMLLSSYQALQDGGLAGFLWSYCFTAVGLGFVMLCLAEMASMAPTSGGQYHWVSEFAPPQHQRMLSYVTGWMATISWQTGSASGTFLTGTVVQGLIDAEVRGYDPKTWQSTLLVFAMILLCYVANIWGAKHLPSLQNLLLLVHIFGFFAFIIVVWVMSPRNTAETVFTQFYSTGGLSSMALTVIVGQNNAIFALTGSDATAHMSEEIKDASRNVPIAMLYAYLLNCSIAFVLLITFLFGVTDVETALNDPSGFPFFWVLGQTVSMTGINILMTIILLLATASNISYNASTSRQTFAFARDKGLPLAKWIGTVDHRTHVPANALLVTALISAMLSLVNIGSSTLFSALVSIQVSAQMFSYIVSMSCLLWRRIKHPATLPPGRFTLGRHGLTVNVIAIAYALFAFFFSFWPSTLSPALNELNWAAVPFVSVTILTVAYCYWKREDLAYRGPVVDVEGRRVSVSMM